MQGWPEHSYRIFISYARDDSTDIALKLRNDLSAAGHDTWLDLAEIAAGSSWARDIESAIEHCDVVLALLSTGSYVSDICRAEQMRAVRKNKRVIPIQVQPDADRPLHLEHLNYMDFSETTNYEPLLADLVDYIVTGQLPASAINVSEAQTAGDTRPFAPLEPPLDESDSTQPMLIKRDTRAFRRYIAELRGEPWLGTRRWWTHFLFYFDDVQAIAQVLNDGHIPPPQAQRGWRPTVWENSVRLYFRPLTPDLYGAEGVRPLEARLSRHYAVPVYLLFDLETVVTLPDARFSEGDVLKTRKTFSAASAFRDLPFDLIYHNSPVIDGEREEIINARRAQVILNEPLKLDALRFIWCRSNAERETLWTLLTQDARHSFSDKLTTRTDYQLFNQRWPYVTSATLSPEGALFEFNPCGTKRIECGPFDAVRADFTTADGTTHVIDLGELYTDNGLSIDLTSTRIRPPYDLRLYLDDALCFAGRCVG
jgi:hypothetical protein